MDNYQRGTSSASRQDLLGLAETVIDIFENVRASGVADVALEQSQIEIVLIDRLYRDNLRLHDLDGLETVLGFLSHPIVAILETGDDGYRMRGSREDAIARLTELMRLLSGAPTPNPEDSASAEEESQLNAVAKDDNDSSVDGKDGQASAREEMIEASEYYHTHYPPESQLHEATSESIVIRAVLRRLQYGQPLRTEYEVAYQEKDTLELEKVSTHSEYAAAREEYESRCEILQKNGHSLASGVNRCGLCHDPQDRHSVPFREYRGYMLCDRCVTILSYIPDDQPVNDATIQDARRQLALANQTDQLS